MSSKIEQIITEIEEYIDNCKFQPLSTSKIVVNKDDIDELLAELRLRTPDEIKKYQKIIANKDAILNDTKERSEAMIAEQHTLISWLVNMKLCRKHMMKLTRLLNRHSRKLRIF